MRRDPTRRGVLALVAAAVLAPTATMPATAAAGPAVVPVAPPPLPRVWLPTDYQDDFIYHVSDSPSDWLLPRGSGHVLADYNGEEPDEDAPLLADGVVIAIDYRTQHGSGTLTVHGLPDDDEDEAAWQRATLEPPMPPAPPGSQMCLCCADEVEMSGVDWRELASELDTGSYKMTFYAWGTQHFRYCAATGTLVPVTRAEAAHGG